MTTEFQPRERLPFYLPENWLPLDTASSGSGSYINYPTAQTANISFPGSILCSSLQSFAPTAPMNLFNNSTTGSIQIGNNTGYTGGIVINANAFAPANNTIRIGDSSRPLIAPLLKTSDIQGTGALPSLVNVSADLQVATGYGLYTNSIEKSTGSVLNIGATSAATINLGTNLSRTEAINIGTNMTVAGDINLGGTDGTTNAKKLESELISCEGNNPLSIGGFVGRTQYIGIGIGMTGGSIFLGGAYTNTTLNNLTSNTTLNIQQSDELGEGAVQIGCGDMRIGNIDIGVNTSNNLGETPGNVNIMNGAGKQQGSFNVLTNSQNRGVINLGNTGALEGGINIYATFKRGIKIGWGLGTYSGIDTYLGGYKKETYQSFTSMTLDTTDQRIVGSTPEFLGTGIYQFNVMTTFKSSILNPYLGYGVYTKTTGSAWVNGDLRGTDGTPIDELTRANTHLTTDVTDVFTMSLSGILVHTSKSYIAIVVGNGDTTLSQNITYTDTYMSFMRMG